eukprot:6214357-Pleurochrysis_carterae.AAC.10
MKHNAISKQSGMAGSRGVSPGKASCREALRTSCAWSLQAAEGRRAGSRLSPACKSSGTTLPMPTNKGGASNLFCRACVLTCSARIRANLALPSFERSARAAAQTSNAASYSAGVAKGSALQKRQRRGSSSPGIGRWAASYNTGMEVNGSLHAFRSSCAASSQVAGGAGACTTGSTDRSLGRTLLLSCPQLRGKRRARRCCLAV